MRCTPFSDVRHHQFSHTTIGCSKRLSNKAAGEQQPEAYPLGYVEDCSEPRTQLEAFFSILCGRHGGRPERDVDAHHGVHTKTQGATVRQEKTGAWATQWLQSRHPLPL